MPEEYISRAAAIEEIDKWLDTVGTVLVGKGLSYYGELIGCIEDTPAADVAEVVRCKDCKHRTEYGNCGHPRQKGVFPSAYPFDFCSYGGYKTNTGGNGNVSD